MLFSHFAFRVYGGSAQQKIKLNSLLKMLLLLFRCWFGVFCANLIILRYQDGPRGN